MAEIKSSLLNAEDMKYVKASLEHASEQDGKTTFRVKTVEYINDSASDNADQFFYDSLVYLRFLSKAEGHDHIAFTTPDKFIYMVCPDAENGPGEKIRVWEFIYCHECLHQLWDTFGVADRIKQEGLEYNHMLLNVASDCVINDYLSYYRKKERYEDGIFPEVLEKDYGVTYDRKKDTQYTLYCKLLQMKKENPNKYEKMQDDPVFNGKLEPKDIQDGGDGGGGGPQVQHSPDYIKGWTQGIQDTLDGKVDPKTYKPKQPQNDYDQGYNDVIAQIKKGLEEGISISKDGGGGGNGGGSDLPQIPWNVPPQKSKSGGGSGKSSNQDQQQSPEDSAKDAEKSANDAQKSASQAQKAADDAQAKADKSGDGADQQAADDAQKAADEAKAAADKAKEAADKAKEAADEGDAKGASKAADDAADAASKAAQAAQEATSNGMSAGEASANAAASAKKAQEAADAVEKMAQDASGEKAEGIKSAANDAKEAAKAAQEAADKAKEAANKGNVKAAREAANEAAEKARLAEDAKRIAEDVKSGKYQKSDQSYNTEDNSSNNKQAGTNDGQWPPRFESAEDLEKLRKQHEEELKRWSKKMAGDLGKFTSQCKLSKELKKDGLVVQTTNRASTGWNTQMNQYINSYVKKKVFQKKRQYESTYTRIKRGSGFVKFGQPINPGRKIREDKLNINVAFYVDRSGSMGNCIDDVFKATYVISDSLKRQFGKDPVVDKTEFNMFAFDMKMHQIKWGNRINADGGTMDFDKILEFISHNTKEYLINVIITDAGFSIDKALVERFMKDIEGMVLFITNSPSQPMKELAKKYATQLFYIEADSQFTLDK